ncbi:hypothetical protein GYB61_12885 [bacterium]|nr:hypothetical protein [bacterium]
MPRKASITQDDVSAACDALEVAEVNVTRRAVREHLQTTASETTLGPLVDAWRRSSEVASKDFDALPEAQQVSIKRMIGRMAGTMRDHYESSSSKRVDELRIVTQKMEADAEEDRLVIAEKVDALAKSAATAEQLLADLRQAESQVAAADARIAILEQSVTKQTERADLAHQQVVELVGRLGRRVQEQLELTMDD